VFLWWVLIIRMLGIMPTKEGMVDGFVVDGFVKSEEPRREEHRANECIISSPNPQALPDSGSRPAAGQPTNSASSKTVHPRSNSTPRVTSHDSATLSTTIKYLSRSRYPALSRSRHPALSRSRHPALSRSRPRQTMTWSAPNFDLMNSNKQYI